jgi:hypothetical protein
VKRNAIVAVAGVCLLSLATPVEAQGIIGRGWLERLSGPGPFDGIAIDARLLCLAETPRARARGGEISLDGESIGARLTYPRDIESRVWFTPAGCHFLNRDQTRIQIGVDIGFLDSKRNVLDYSHRPDVSEDDRQVNLNVLMLTADLRVNRMLDVGAAIGGGFFSSRRDVFPSFSRMVSQPMRLTTRPAAAVFDSRWAEVVVVRFDGTKFHGTFTDEDFGARPGTFIEPGEIIWNWSIQFDLGAVLWR